MAFPTSGDIFLLSLCFFLFWIITQFDFTLFMPVNIIDSSFGASVLGWEYNLPWEEVPSCPLLQPDYTSTSLLSKLLKKFLTHTHTYSACAAYKWVPYMKTFSCYCSMYIGWGGIWRHPQRPLSFRYPHLSKNVSVNLCCTQNCNFWIPRFSQPTETPDLEVLDFFSRIHMFIFNHIFFFLFFPGMF